MKTFLSWSGEASHEVAKALKDWLVNLLPELDMWISDELPGGRRWSLELADKLEQTDSGIVTLTKESLASPWVYFECGALSKSMRTSRVFPYLFDVDTNDYADNPLKEFQAREADKEGTQRLVADLNATLERPRPAQTLNYLFDKTWPDLEKRFEEIREEVSGLNEILDGKAKFDSTFAKIKKADLLQENQYLRRVVIKSIKEFSFGLKSLLSSDKSYSLPYILYPAYLTGLLQALRPLTQAIAIVDNDEPFWNQKDGRQILELTQPQSTRVFAFYDHAHLQTYLHTVQLHARKYDVRVIDYDLLPPFYSAKPYDFSIIGDINSTSLLAVYDEEELLMKRIKFTADTGTISRHHDRFKAILEASVRVPRDFNAEEKGDWLVAEAFPADRGPKLTQLQQRHIEMSSYIHPQEYHLHEEKHAYYVPMMERMIALCQDHPLSERGAGRRMRALELGAGTGLLTKRLLLMKYIDLTAIELDWACYHILLENMMDILDMQKRYSEREPDAGPAGDDRLPIEGWARLRDVFTSDALDSIVRCVNADSRTYNPEGTFAYIFSSFADHHIKTIDKAEYFENIKLNLEKGGLVIVGDELLPPYDENDMASRERALNSYHRHIIEETRRQHGEDAWGLIQLEEAALESGLKGIGDFKLSCELYERYLTEAGFRFEKELIGPLDRDDVGGVYVYKLFI